MKENTKRMRGIRKQHTKAGEKEEKKELAENKFVPPVIVPLGRASAPAPAQPPALPQSFSMFEKDKTIMNQGAFVNKGKGEICCDTESPEGCKVQTEEAYGPQYIDAVNQRQRAGPNLSYLVPPLPLSLCRFPLLFPPLSCFYFPSLQSVRLTFGNVA